MATDNNKPWHMGDGTSQSGRILAALDPNYVQVDERTTQDLLAFAKKYAGELKYFGLDNLDHGSHWSGFIPDDIDLEEAARYVEYPESFSPQQAAPFTRPHLALFLVFLKLLGQTRNQINTLTRSHLEFFYRDVLKMVRKKSVPDKVHVLVELEHGTDQQRIPLGTDLQAGKDSLGQPLTYCTEHELIANNIEIGQISSLYSQIKITGLKEACPPNLIGGNRKEAFVAMLRIALGQPNPGDPLPLPIYPGVPSANQEINFSILEKAQRLIHVAITQLYMTDQSNPSFDDFRELMKRKKLREDKDDTAWESINTYLNNAGKKNQSSFLNILEDSRDFDSNLMALLNKTSLDELFNKVTEVKSIDDAYDACLRRLDEKTIIGFIKEALLPLSLDDFKSMMKIKTEMDVQWNEINLLLEKAAQRRPNGINESPIDEPQLSYDFAAKLTAAVGEPVFTIDGGLDVYYEAFVDVERYFSMSAENFYYIMSVAAPLAPLPPLANSNINNDEQDWNRVYGIVTAAHRRMIYTRRREVLKQIAQPALNLAPKANIKNNIQALSDMLNIVLGEKHSEQKQYLKKSDLAQQVTKALNKLGEYGLADKDISYLSHIVNEKVESTVEPTPIDWEYVYKVLEVAQRNRQALAQPIPEQIEWRNVYAAADATIITAQTDDQARSRWKTFGQGERVCEKDPAPDASFGWAMASPLLVLSEGKRTITLTLGFSNAVDKFNLEQMLALLIPGQSGDNAPQSASVIPFQVQLSTEKGWLEPESVILKWTGPDMTYSPLGEREAENQSSDSLEHNELRGLVFECTLTPSQPALCSLTRDVHGMDATFPVLRLMLKPIWNEQDSCYLTTSYTVLRNLTLMRAHMHVAVSELSHITMGNDQSNLDAKKPFEPFGLQPAVGSRFYFGHPEIVAKKLDSLSFGITWMGKPPNLKDHYKNYEIVKDVALVPTELCLKAKVALIEGNVLRDFDSFSLFEAATDDDATRLILPVDQGNPDTTISTSTNVTDWHRYLLWELDSPDFQHSVYPTLALQKSLEMAVAVASKSEAELKPDDYQINPPYTPKIKKLTLDYTASARLDFDASINQEPAMRAFHVEPFGFAELKQNDGEVGCSFLPEFNFEGQLYIGLRNVSPPQNLSLLFQVAEGSANPDLNVEPVQWSYLSGNRWKSLSKDGSLLADATRGLINSGIVELALKPIEPSTLMPQGLYWLRVAIKKASASVCDIVAIHPNATLAIFVDNNNAPEHLITPLPPEGVTAPVIAIPGIASLIQPYTSFGGKPAEQDKRFNVRVSERLRHKQRALTLWDYERLVLEKFPQIYKVKCLRSDPIKYPLEPGRIEIVIIPDIKNRLPFNPFAPKAPADQIQDIQRFLEDKMPPFASLVVKNAVYMPVMVRCGIRFMPGSDEGYCRRQLNEELNRFLSPWAYEEGADLVIGGRIYANSIINFIDRCDYVDYLAGFTLFTGENTLVPDSTEQGYHVSAGRPDVVLVAAREHYFTTITTTDYQVENYNGIGYMKIELDFIVADDANQITKE
jgi:hypothetical protein